MLNGPVCGFHSSSLEFPSHIRYSLADAEFGSLDFFQNRRREWELRAGGGAECDWVSVSVGHLQPYCGSF